MLSRPRSRKRTPDYVCSRYASGLLVGVLCPSLHLALPRFCEDRAPTSALAIYLVNFLYLIRFGSTASGPSRRFLSSS